MKVVTIRDVAVACGMSITAVSMALNDKGTLAESTRSRIVSVADELGYRADALARGLRGSTVGAIGLVIRPLDEMGHEKASETSVFAEVVGAASMAAAARRSSILLLSDLSNRPLPHLAFSMDGYIVVDPVEQDVVVSALRARCLPITTIGRIPGDPNHEQTVLTQDRRDTRSLLRHLVRRGSRSILFTTGSEANAWNIDSAAAHIEFCRELDLPQLTATVVEADGVAGGRSLIAQLAPSEVPDAIAVRTARCAAGVVAELQDRGFSVPGDVRVAAAADGEAARISRPAITAIQQPHAELARKAVESLLTNDEDDLAECFRPSAGRLKIRATT